MWSAVPDAQLVIVMFVMFVVNGAAAPQGLMTLEGLMTYGTLRACLRLLEATKSLCEISESLSDTSV